MEFKNLYGDDRAVSPVIGVILMVAITVILAAVIGTFVLGLGNQVQDTQPRASFGFSTVDVDVSNQADVSTTTSVTGVEITHETGNSLEASNLDVLVNGEQAYTTGASDAVSGTFSGEVAAGSSITIVGATDDSNVGTSGPLFRYDDIPGDDGETGLDVNDSGDTSTVVDGVGLSTEDQVRIVWSSDSGDSSGTLGKFTLP